MINFIDAEPLNSLPLILQKQPWVQALSYAIALMIRRLLILADGSRTFSRVDDITDETVLDALAIDLLVNQYDTSYPIETKRKLVKFALQYWATAGTKKATEDILLKVLYDGYITEWYEYGGDPGYFRVNLTDTTITGQDILKFKEVAENVKRLSAWLDKVVLDMVNDPMTQRVGFIAHEASNDSQKQQRDPNQFYGFILWEAISTIIVQED